MPAAAFTALVGHELAHTYQHAVEGRLTLDSTNRKRADEEEEADEIASGWGCDIHALETWQWRRSRSREVHIYTPCGNFIEVEKEFLSQSGDTPSGGVTAR